MHPQDLRIEDFTYLLPAERIARYPLAERDASKLLIYNKKAITEDIYRNLADHLPAETLMVFNQTKVVHARLLFKKPSGGAIEVFCLAPHRQYPDIHTAMQQKGRVLWECMVGGAAKWKPGAVLELQHEGPSFTLRATIAERSRESFVLSLEWDNDQLSFAEVLQYAGKVPLPPYLQRAAEDGDEERYQTLFAKEEGSVAAPTAGLHFTAGILQDLAAKNIGSAFVTLHVGAGTFKPVKSDIMADHDMHEEWIEVTYDAMQQLIQCLDKKIVAVGTTSLRTLESLYWIGHKMAAGHEMDLSGVSVSQWEPYSADVMTSPKDALTAVARYMGTHQMEQLITRTQILIAPGYEFKIASGLITNFHQPRSTLLLLVAAFIGDDWKRVYEYALGSDFRFLSYGDGSLLWQAE